MKKIFAATLIIVAIVSFAFSKKEKPMTTQHTSVKTHISTDFLNQNTPSDTTILDLEDQMHVYEKEMSVVENKMKPYEKEMQRLEKEMNKRGANQSAVGEEMSKVGTKMSVVGGEMSKIGNKMGVIGEQIGKEHKRIFSWFFKELKSDGLIDLGKSNSVFMEEGIMVVNGKTLDATAFQKYKKGLETQIGKSLRPDFSIYIKGIINLSDDGGFSTNGNMNTHF